MLGKINKKRAVTAGATMCIAAAAGYVMQSGVPGSSATGKAAASVMQAAAQVVPAAFVPTAPQMPAFDTVTRAEGRMLVITPSDPVEIMQPRKAPIRLAAANAELSPADLSPAPEPDPVIAKCDVGFTAMAAAGAMVDLTLEAPCYDSQAVDFFHAGLRFTGILTAEGLFQTSVPAMEEDAIFAATFTDGRTESVNIQMFTVADYQRVAMSWKGITGFQIHALEDDATYGEAGHVWAGAPGTPDRATQGEGGFLTLLGQADGAYMAEVYTYPTMMTDTRPTPDISIEAEVLATTCGHMIEATFLRVDPFGAPADTDVSMAVPACDALGEFLVLKNLPQDLRIAHN